MKQLKYLSMSGLKDGTLYKITARNGNYGVWIEKKKGFVLSRFKFGDNFPFVEYHYDSDPHFGTAKPLEEVEKCSVDTENYTSNEMLDYLNNVDNNTRCQLCGQSKGDWLTHLADCPNKNKID
jgi:hypothetical protein